MTTTNTNSSARTLTIPNLVNGQIYRARVSAVNNYGQGPFANWIQVTPSQFSTDEYYYDNTLLMHFDDNRTGTYDPYGDNVSLLMRMNGTNNSTTFIDSSLYSNPITAYGSAKITTFSSEFGETSAQLIGTASYLTLPTNTQLSLGTEDFTIECWIHLNAYSNNAFWESNEMGTAGSRGNGFVWYTSNGYVYIFRSGENILVTSEQNTIPLNTWTHISLVRLSGTTTFYVNGVAKASTATSYNDTNGGRVIGAFCDGPNSSPDMRIDDFRVTKGIARYTSNFSIPTEAFPAISPLFVDSSAYNNPLIISSTSISSSSSKFGGYAGYFNGSSFVRSNGTDIWQLGTDDFTVESWINPNNIGGTRSIAGNYDGSDGGWRLAVKPPIGTPIYGPEVTFTATNDGSEVDVIIDGVLEITRNNQNGIYNSAVEGSYDSNVSPANTAWNRCQVYSTCHGSYVYCPQDSNNWDNICNYASRDYGVWRNYAVLRYCNGTGATSSTIGKELIMKHVPTNRYWAIKFTSWQTHAQGGAFSYVRKEILGCTVDNSVIQFRNGNSTVIEKSVTPPLASGTWYHIAAVRSSGVLKLFLDGTQVGSDSSFTANITRNNSYGLSVGAYTLSNGSSSDYFNGYLDDLRITKGVSRYLTNFNKPVAPAPDLGIASTVPSTPSNLAVSEDQGIVSLSWNRPSYPRVVDTRAPITYYGVEYSGDGGSSWTEHSVVSGGSLLTRSISGLPANTPYLFRVRAQNSVGFGPYSSTANISTLTNAPSSVSAIGDDSQAFVSWTAPTPNNSSIRDYGIQYSSDAGSSWDIYSHSSSIDTLINVTGLNNTLNYSFKVAAVNLAGTGIYSSDSSPITVAPRTDSLYNKTRILLHLDSN